MGKKALCLIFAFLLSIESMAAVVSDNDGAAFVTKAEFETLKDNFANQVNQYNQSIDGKIDGAIASYLAGIKVEHEPDDLYDKIKVAVGGDLVFRNTIDTTTATTSPEIAITCINRYYVKTNITPDVDFETWRREPSTSTYERWAAKCIGSADGASGYQDYNFDECQEHAISFNGTTTFDNSSLTGGTLINAWQSWSRCTYACGKYVWSDSSKNPVVKVKNQNIGSITATGTGQVYTFNTESGRRVLDEYASSYWPMIRGTAYYHSYGNFYATSQANYRNWHETDNAMKLTTVQTANTNRRESWGTSSWGTEVTDESEGYGYWGSVTYALCKNTDGHDYSIVQWGIGTDTDIYALPTDQQVNVDTSATTWTFSSSTYEREMYDSSLVKKTQTNDLPANKLEYYKPSITPLAYKLNTFANNYLSAIAGEAVYMGGGMPVLQTEDTDQKVKVTFTLATSGSSANKIKVIFSDKQFKNGATDIGNGGRELYTGECNVGTEYALTFVLEKNNQLLWMNLYDLTTGCDAWLSDFKIELL